MIPSLRKLVEEKQRIEQNQKEQQERESETNHKRAEAMAEAAWPVFCLNHAGPAAVARHDVYVDNANNRRILESWIRERQAYISPETLNRAFSACRLLLSSEPGEVEPVVPAPSPEFPPVPYSAAQIRQMSPVEYRTVCRRHGWENVNAVLEAEPKKENKPTIL